MAGGLRRAAGDLVEQPAARAARGRRSRLPRPAGLALGRPLPALADRVGAGAGVVVGAEAAAPAALPGAIGVRAGIEIGDRERARLVATAVARRVDLLAAIAVGEA